MESRKIKDILINYFKWERGYDFVGTEVCFMDVVAVGLHDIIEIEVKISESDFFNDFGKRKHYLYDSFFSDEEMDHQTPNKFYYAVPEKIKQKVIDHLEQNKKYGIIKNYGVLSIQENGNPYVAKNARVINKKYSESLKREVFKRIFTEYLLMLELFQSITKNQKRHKRVYDKIKSFMEFYVRSCRGCELRKQSSLCPLLHEYIKEDKMNKKRCRFLFLEKGKDFE